MQARFAFNKKNTPQKRASKPSSDRRLWYPGAIAPEWLDGSLVGDYGFDPFGLGKPAEYLQFDLDSLDSLDQNLAKNVAGDVIGTRFENADVKSTRSSYTVRHLGCRGSVSASSSMEGGLCWPRSVLSVEWLTSVSWQDAGKVLKYC